MKRTLTGLLMLAASAPQAATYLDDNGLGQAIILPHYTVRNDTNTFVTVKNQSDTKGKAVMLVFREGRNGENVLSFSVYLTPNDSWSGALLASDSNIPGHVGEPSATLVNNEVSCTPFLSNQQSLLPYDFEANEIMPSTMERVQEGYVEIYEMGEFDPGQQTLDFSNCAALEDYMINVWETGDVNTLIQPSVGEISATLSIIDVAQGTSVSQQGTALAGFFAPESVNHRLPYDALSLNDGVTTSRQLTGSGVVETQWDAGFQAVSSLLNKTQLGFDFSLESIINGQAEAVLGFPTKRFHTMGASATAPFTEVYTDGVGACETGSFAVYDRDGHVINPVSVSDQLCWASQVISVRKNLADPSQVFDSQFELPLIMGSANETGHVKLGFSQSSSADDAVNAEVQWTFTGLPVLGFAVQKYTNAGAQPGLLAQYAGNTAFVAINQIGN
jgi:hypothetical protein